MLSHDPLDAAEKITNERYGGDLGMGMFFRHADAKRRLLEDADDTHHSQSLAEYCRVIERVGFIKLLHIPFTNDMDGVTQDSLQVWWDESRAILLEFDTYYGDKCVNGGNFYYNWLPQHCWNTYERNGVSETVWGWTRDRSYATSSGGGFHYGEDSEGRKLTAWRGYHDCREALAFHIRQLEQHGEFIKPWREHDKVWLTHYADCRDSDTWQKLAGFDRISLERWQMLPESVRTTCAFNPERYLRKVKP